MTQPKIKDVKEPQPVYGQLPTNAEANLEGSLAAIRRAAQRARQVAQQTGTDLIVVRGGRVIRVGPEKKPHP